VAALALCRLLDLEHDKARRRVNAERLGRHVAIGFFFARMILGSEE
jgi:hypothetical protein